MPELYELLNYYIIYSNSSIESNEDYSRVVLKIFKKSFVKDSNSEISPYLGASLMQIWFLHSKNISLKVVIDTLLFANEQLQNIKSRYDYVIIDTPPRSKSVAVINAMTTSNEVIIPMQANSFSIEGLQKILETFEMVKKYTNHNIKVLGILMTMYEDRTLFRRGITKQMENLSTKIQIPLFKTTIRRGIAMEEAQSQKTNIFEYNMKSNVAKDYQDFIDEVIKKEKELDSNMNESEAK